METPPPGPATSPPRRSTPRFPVLPAPPGRYRCVNLCTGRFT